MVWVRHFCIRDIDDSDDIDDVTKNDAENVVEMAQNVGKNVAKNVFKNGSKRRRKVTKLWRSKHRQEMAKRTRHVTLLNVDKDTKMWSTETTQKRR
jgi:hypothetical protein